jgi:hypothetical protein
LNPSDSYFLFVDFVDFYTHWTYILYMRINHMVKKCFYSPPCATFPQDLSPIDPHIFNYKNLNLHITTRWTVS